MRANPVSRGRDRARGFTLLEVVVALAIASLALVGMFRAGSGGLFASDTAARVEEAIERAQSHLAGFGRTGAVAPGELAGDDGGGFTWRVRVQPLAAAPVMLQGQSAAARALYAVQVTITWRGAGRTRSVVLDTRRLGAAAASNE